MPRKPWKPPKKKVKPSKKKKKVKPRKRPSEGAMYAAAICDDNGLWLLARVKRSRSGIYFLMQREIPDWDPHASHHTGGIRHVRSYEWTHFETQEQKLDATFRGVQTLFSMGISTGEEVLYTIPCDAGKFDDVFQIPRQLFVAGEPHTLVADIIEPGQGAAPGAWRDIVVQKSFQDAVPWILFTLWRGLA
jgi:hypothetical protein